MKNNDYIFIYNFNVTSMFNKYVDIILGSHWIETLGTFILNLKKKILKFSNKKKIILLDITINSCYVVPSLEDLKDGSDVIPQNSQKSIQKLYDHWKELGRIIDKDKLCTLRIIVKIRLHKLRSYKVKKCHNKKHWSNLLAKNHWLINKQWLISLSETSH